jgi:hypothetical protein
MQYRSKLFSSFNGLPVLRAQGPLAAVLASGPSMAQTPLQSMPEGSEGFSRPTPSQITFPPLEDMFTPQILGLFAFNCLLLLAITSAIAFHPARTRSRRGIRDYELPRLFFLYALIGMGIGFLVLQYGAVIGFVIFGIGGLLRFRSVINNSTDTVEVILVTLLGLCIGLNLQNMALLLAIISWVLIWVFGLKRAYQLSLRLKGTADLETVMDGLETQMQALGWEQDRQKRSVQYSDTTGANAAATVVFRTGSAHEVSEVEKELSKHFRGQEIEWRLK